MKRCQWWLSSVFLEKSGSFKLLFKPIFALSLPEIILLLMSYHLPLNLFNLYRMGLKCNWGKREERGGTLHICHAKYLYCYLYFLYSFWYFLILLAVIAKGLGNKYISIRLYLLLIVSAVTVNIIWRLVSQYHFSSFLHLDS